MTDSSGGVPFHIRNMREGNRYIKSGTTLFPCPSSTDISNLRPDQEVITVLSKQTGGIVVEHDSTYVTKSGERVRPAEAEAMRLVSKHTSVPVGSQALSIGNMRDGIRIIGSMHRFRGLLSGVIGQYGWIGLHRRDGILVGLMLPGRFCFNVVIATKCYL